MKINVDIDATPEELRTFFGLPDLKPLQDEVLQAVRQKMVQGVEGYEPLNLLKPFLAPQMQNFDALQKVFWDSFARQGFGTDKKSDD